MIATRSKKALPPAEITGSTEGGDQVAFTEFASQVGNVLQERVNLGNGLRRPGGSDGALIAGDAYQLQVGYVGDLLSERDGFRDRTHAVRGCAEAAHCLDVGVDGRSHSTATGVPASPRKIFYS